MTDSVLDTPPQDVLAELHREGRLAAEYPRVRGLLNRLSDEQLPRFGQLLSRLTAEEVLAHHPAQPVVSIAITGHGTLAALVPALTTELARHGLLLRPQLADFDSYVFDLTDPDSELYRFGPDLALCLLDPFVVLDELPTPWTPADAERVLAAKVDLVDRLATSFEQAGGRTLVVNTVPLLRETVTQLVAGRARAELSAVWHEANARLLRLGERHPGLVVVDLAPLLAEGVPARDPRMSVYAKAHLSAELLAGYAREVGALAREAAGRTRKCLVLDLDGTLWGGILGDDGPEGIELGDGYRGEAFQRFQRVVRQIGSQGVLLAVVSKNDPEPVRQVLREHPGMVLREEDFVRVAANWQPKHDNLRALAETLNVGTDSFVFVDDSPYECGLVERELPDVAVVRLGEDPALHVGAVLREGWFAVRELTAEDRGRTVKYREELARKDFLTGFESIQDYLRELRVEVRLSAVTPEQVARVSQLTLRTNQFNLTTTRLQAADVSRLAADPDHLVLAIHAADRFGDNGLVGAVFYRREGDTGHVDNFLLSCRVFSRGIEGACLSAVLRHARESGVRTVRAAYRPTAKNTKVKAFYPANGFAAAGEPAGATGQDGAAVFQHDLAQIAGTPAHVRLTEDFEGMRP
ncbi:HAD-IIIC family phosphatase [Kitasatospora aureofaciens]|uniref:HAD-IIIC family phosphatase n=1 Tax=Kitasatospora aureofaciens TaxID=1894 RepID=UPI0037CCAEDE